MWMQFYVVIAWHGFPNAIFSYDCVVVYKISADLVHYAVLLLVKTGCWFLTLFAFVAMSDAF